MELIAQGTERKQRWRRTVAAGQTLVLGRESGPWSVPWDDKISRRHVEFRLESDGQLDVRQLPDATNPVFYRGQRQRQFTVQRGEAFVIGSTTFTLVDEQAAATLDLPRPVTERTYSLNYLRQLEYRHTHRRFDLLSELPELLAQAPTESDWLVQLVNAILRGISRATAAAVVQLDPAETGPSQLLHWDRTDDHPPGFNPSQLLIRQAIERQESVVHAWNVSPSTDGPPGASVLWAFCTPVTGSASRGWAIYVTGYDDRPMPNTPAADPVDSSSTDPFHLQDDLKYTELVASIVGSVRQLRWLERRQATLSQCFSPVVVEALADANPESVLAPREAQVSVLFCDLRGFTRRSEESSDDLFGLLERVSEALGVVTHHILEHRGVIGDFHGDAAMGFWGWPLPVPDSIGRACQAALEIRRELEEASQQSGHPLANFRVGLGLATGRAVAGTIGTRDQVKVTVFGPVVNLASRLETMTKTFRAPVLIDSPTAEYVRSHVPSSVARVRRLAVVRPVGFRQAVEVNELLPPAGSHRQLTDADIATYEAGLAALMSGDWTTAMEHLHAVPANDQAKDFLTVFIARHNRIPPDDWNGVISLAEK